MEDHNRNQPGGVPKDWTSPSQRLAAGHPDPMLGVRLVSGGAIVAWCNPAARKELCLSADKSQPLGLDAALDAAVEPAAFDAERLAERDGFVARVFEALGQPADVRSGQEE